MKHTVTFLFSVVLGFMLQAQHKTENIIIVTLDGMRWQEVFGGVDEVLMYDKTYDHNTDEIKKKFWAAAEEERRIKLFPFLWTIVGTQGQLYGNRKYDNKIDNANPYWFSYPGYSEIFTGYPDTAINSNDKIYNPNENVLEFINKQMGYTGKIAAFTSWDAFPYILNNKRSGLYVNADVDTIKLSEPNLQLINDIQLLSTRPVDIRTDVLTYIAGREYLKAYKPRILYISLGETDDYAHAGFYEQYIASARQSDAMIADLWKAIQLIPQYKDKTTMIITCDHGRGDKIKSTWMSHGAKIEDAHELWMAVIGPDTKPLGEMKTAGQLYQKQIAATIAKLLGFTFVANHPVGDPINSIYKK
jgi:Metalloenzyme superfamily